MKTPVVQADWWNRTLDDRSQPSYQRNIPAESPDPTAVPTTDPGQQTNPPAQPTSTPRVGDPGQTTDNSANSDTDNTSSDSSSDEDPCAPGKGYYGPYCGWSPRVGGEEGSGTSVSQTAYSGPQVRGLSYTGSSDLAPSDIILLTGILCLALYLRSKMPKIGLE